jgi:DNA polymerase-3 subunit delta'
LKLSEKAAFLFSILSLTSLKIYVQTMQFREVIGQQEVKQHLAEIVQHNRLSHALLFLGKEGSGALSLAMALAQFLTCEKTQTKDSPENISLFGKGQEKEKELLNDSCGVCSSCMKANELVHPDIHFSYPVVTKKAGTPPVSTDYITEWREFVRSFPYGNVYDWLQFIGADNRQGNITAQECNDIIHQLSLKSFESGYKILIMWMPEYLGKEGNKLLKLIEEPPANTLFILVAENESQILSTILSRCQLVKIPALDNAEVERALTERNQCKPEQARQIAGVCEGNYREALHLLQHSEEDFHGLLREWLNATVKYQVQAQVKFIEEMARLGRETQKQFLRYFTHLLEQAVRLQILEGELRINFLQSLSASEQDFTARLNKIMTLEQKEAVAEELDKAAYYIERNANAKILFHALTIKLFYIVKNNLVIAV